MSARRIVSLGGALAGVLVLAACLPSLTQVSPDDSTPWPGGGPAPSYSGDPTQLALYSQRLDWFPCDGLECAYLEVPLDWTDPAGTTITLAINRSLARVPSERIGSLLLNPGGPGGSGLGMTDYIVSVAGDDVLDRYDLIGFDPRGVGQSTALACGMGTELDAYFLTDTVVQTEAELQASRQKTTDFAQRCRELTGPLIENVDTASAARDMDVIRAVLGDEKLNYFGFSYGTQLGATYVTLYPQNVGHVVLDGAVDFLLPNEELSLGQAEGFEKALDAYLTDCVASANCPFPRDVALAKRTISDLLTTARTEGVPTGGEVLNGTLFVYGIVVTLYDNATWSYLSQAFQELIDRGTGRTFLDFANIYLERTSEGSYQSNANEAFTAISCLDVRPAPLMTIAEFRDFQRKAEEASPTFGWWFGSGAGCEGWPWSAKEPIFDVSAGATAAPFVIIGTTGDPATPYAWAQSLTAQFPTATLLTFVGEGHTAYGRSNQCIIDAVDAYLVDGTVPAVGTTC